MLALPIVILIINDESDKEFMKQLYVQYNLVMFKMARALTATDHDAEDVVADACVSLIKKISLLKQLDCNVLEGYVISTVKNAAYALHRKRRVQKEVENASEILEKIEDRGCAPDEHILQQSSISELMAAIDQLSESDQMVIRMKYFQYLSDCEIAAILSVQEVSVRSKLTRARKRIYRLLGAMQNDYNK